MFRKIRYSDDQALSLRSLADEIPNVEANEAAIVAETGWKNLGSNDTERGHTIVSMMNEQGCESHSATKRRLDSAIAQAGLTAAMLNYLAKDCQETEPQDFDIDTTGADVAGAVNGNVPDGLLSGLFDELGL